MEEGRHKGTDYPDIQFARVQDKHNADDYRRIALELSKALTASEEALGLCVESVPIEAVELIEVLDEYVNYLGDYCDSVAGYLHAHNMGPGDFTVSTGNTLRARLAERRQAYLRRKEG